MTFGDFNFLQVWVTIFYGRGVEIFPQGVYRGTGTMKSGGYGVHGGFYIAFSRFARFAQTDLVCAKGGLLKGAIPCPPPWKLLWANRSPDRN